MGDFRKRRAITPITTKRIIENDIRTLALVVKSFGLPVLDVSEELDSVDPVADPVADPEYLVLSISLFT
jgi:hypothetical protein